MAKIKIAASPVHGSSSKFIILYFCPVTDLWFPMYDRTKGKIITGTPATPIRMAREIAVKKRFYLVKKPMLCNPVSESVVNCKPTIMVYDITGVLTRTYTPSMIWFRGVMDKLSEASKLRKMLRESL